MKKGFFDGAMVLLERSVLYGELENIDRWKKSEIPRNEDVKLDQVIKVLMNQVERNCKPDCGCG